MGNPLVRDWPDPAARALGSPAQFLIDLGTGLSVEFPEATDDAVRGQARDLEEHRCGPKHSMNLVP